MRSSHPSTASSSRGGVAPRAPYVSHDPPHDPNARKDLRSQLHNTRYNWRRFMAFMSILLGDDEVLDEGVPGNKREKGRGVQPHGGELAYPTSTLWLPENWENRVTTLGYKDNKDFMDHMKIYLREVLEFGASATRLAKAFARMEFRLVEPVLFSVPDLRVALQALFRGMDTKPRPMDGPLLPNILDTSAAFVPRASYILEPLPPKADSDTGDLASQLRDRYYDSKQFYIFVSILLGEDQPPGEGATAHDRGGALSVTDHDALQPHGVLKTTVWLPEYLKKRDAIPDYSFLQCWQTLARLFQEVIKVGARTTDLAKAIARMKIEDVKSFIDDPRVLRSLLQRIDVIAEDKNIRELIKMFMPEVETDPNTSIPPYALPEEFLPDVEPIDDDYIKLSVFHFFGQM